MVFSFRFLLAAAALALVASAPAHGGERDFRLSAPDVLIESGFLKHLLPRFSLKTQTRIALVAPGEASEAALGATGKPVFDGLGQSWKLDIRAPDHPGVIRFADWIGSEVGLRTIAGFEVDGTPPFTAPQQRAADLVALEFDGDPARGLEAAKHHCKRCHSVTPEDRINSIGSTPSFFVLRSLPDWSARFESFYALNPHPAFTQVADVTPPFDDARPPPIVPVRITLDDLEAIVAYVAELAPADLGAPIQHQ